jgi:phosphopentomutase
MDKSTTAEAWLNSMDSLLSLTENQRIALEGIYLKCEVERSSIELSLLELQREPMDPMEWEIKDNALRKKKKDLSKEREEKILAELNTEQQNIYIAKVSPNKPQVLHMGLKHDKINCNICVKPSTP